MPKSGFEGLHRRTQGPCACFQDAREEYEAAGGGKESQNGSAQQPAAGNGDTPMAEAQVCRLSLLSVLTAVLVGGFSHEGATAIQADGTLGVTDDREASKAAALAERKKELTEATDTQRALFLLVPFTHILTFDILA